MFLYRKDFHKLRQSRGEDPERFSARIKQLAPACKFTYDDNTPKYGADIMSTIFVMGLGDNYTRERLYQMKTDAGKSTVNFGKLVDAASEIAVAKDNAAESGGSVTMNKTSGGDKSKSKCGYCNTDFHNSSGFLTEARQKLSKKV